jgi:hypothetical protein
MDVSWNSFGNPMDFLRIPYGGLFGAGERPGAGDARGRGGRAPERGCVWISVDFLRIEFPMDFQWNSFWFRNDVL